MTVRHLSMDSAGSGSSEPPSSNSSGESGYDSDMEGELSSGITLNMHSLLPKLYLTSSSNSSAYRPLPPPPPRPGKTQRVPPPAPHKYTVVNSSSTQQPSTQSPTSPPRPQSAGRRQILQSNSNSPPPPRVRRRFRKSPSNKLLKTVLKRVQREVNLKRLKENKAPLVGASPAIRRALQATKSRPAQPKPASVSSVFANFEEIKHVSSASVANLMCTSAESSLSLVSILDTRAPFEFELGHIKGSINIFTKDIMEEFFDLEDGTQHKPEVLIFYSQNFSQSELGLAHFLRELDVRVNRETTRKLSFPRIYLLNDGFKTFQNDYPDLCQAQTAL